MPPKGKKKQTGGKKKKGKNAGTIGKGSQKPTKTDTPPPTEEKPVYVPPPYNPKDPTHSSHLYNVPQHFRVKDVYFKDSEWYWSPRSIVFTNEGELWISDPPRYRIVRYKYNDALEFERLTDINTSCECYQLKCHQTKGVIGLAKQEKREGFVKFNYVNKEEGCPPVLEVRKTWRDSPSLQRVESGDTKKGNNAVKGKSKKGSKKKGKNNSSSNKKGGGGKKTGESERSPEKTRRVSPKEEEAKAQEQFFSRTDQVLDLAPDEDNLLYVIYHPQFSLDILLLETLEKQESYVISEHERFVDFMNVGGLVAKNKKVYLLANNPPTIMIFHVKKECVYDVIDRISLIHQRSVGQFHLMSPHSIACDWFGNILVTDQQHHCIRVYNGDGLFVGEIGNLQDPIQPNKPGHIAVSKNGIIAYIEHGSNHSLVLMNSLHLKFYHDTCLVFRKRLIRF